MFRRTVSAVMLAMLLTSTLTLAFNTHRGDGWFVESNNRGFDVDSLAERRWSFDRAREWSDFAYVDGDSAELVIGVSDARPDAYAELSRIVTVNGGKIVNDVSIRESTRAVVADIPFDLVPSVVYEIKAAGLAKYVEPNFKFQAQFVPNDPDLSLQWGPQKIEADWAWNTVLGDSSILVAVIDTGIDYDHPDLVANYVALGYDWVNNDDDPMDDHGHGTHVAGIIAAEINNSVGIAGLAQVKIMAEKGLDQYGYGSSSGLANAIIHAVDQGADILSNSWGSYEQSALIHDAVKYAYDAEVLIVAAAGNEATSSRLFPAAYDEVIAVTATDQSDNPAWFTNFGDWVEVAAPGVDIYSTVWDNSYGKKSGTSMATPHVSGVAALIWSQFPYLTRDQVRARLQYTADDLGDPGFDEYYGYGRINARKAVEWPLPYHDLSLSLEVPTELVEPRKSTILNATVHNVGLSNETNVELYLLINGTVVRNVTIAELLMGAPFTVSYLWTPTEPGEFNVTAYAPPVPNEEYILTNIATRSAYAQFYTRTYLPNAWISGGTPMSWHADDANWTYPLPFNFPFYGNNYSSIYVSSNGLITFLNPDSSFSNSISALAGKSAIAPAWNDWVTYDPYDIYIWQGSNRVSIRWYVRAYGSSTEANFEAVLTADGEIQFNYQYNDGPVFTTIGVSNGAGDILAEDTTNLSYINTIEFIPWSLALSVHNMNSGLGYSTIQGAIDAPETLDGHTIFVEAGTYYENVVVNKALTLIGEDRETTIIDGNFTGDVVRLMGNSSTIADFTIKNSGYWPTIGISIGSSSNNISRNNIVNNSIGIRSDWGSNYNRIVENSIMNNSHTGISFNEVDHNYISDNFIAGNYYYGIFLGWSSDYNSISENRIMSNGLGIYLCYSSPTFNRIFGNNITNNGRGVSLFDASNNTISGNNIINNTFGFFLAGRSTGSLNNSIYHNDFANNTFQVHDESWVDPEQLPSINVWDDDYPSGGNYWNDDSGRDVFKGAFQNETGSDGIGDTPYVIDASNVDNYPLTKPYAGFFDLGIIKVTPSKMVVGQDYELNITVEALNYGVNAETFNLTMYAGTGEVQTIMGVIIASRSSTALTFNWNTTGFAYGNYTIRAIADTVPGEIDTEDNTFVDGYVFVTIPGDINGDQYVNAKDALMIGMAFYPAGLYNANPDINDDEYVNAKDAIILGTYFGQHW